MAVTASTERQVEALVASCAASGDSTELFESVSRRLRRMVPYDGATWFATDPMTALATCPVRIENVESGHCESYWDREFLVEDSLLFRDLARGSRAAGTLFAATDGHPARSARYREFLAPQGYGDELRAVFRLGSSIWGVLGVFRERGREPFSEREVDLIAGIGPALAAALRARARTEPTPGAAHDVDGPGTALFDAAGTLCSFDEQANHWFTELAGPGWEGDELPPQLAIVTAVLARAHAVAAGRDRGPTSARLRSASGRWLAVHASYLRTPCRWARSRGGGRRTGPVGADRADHHRGVPPDTPRAADHPGGGPRVVQPGDRRGPAPVPAHRARSPQGGLRQGRCRQPGRAGGQAVRRALPAVPARGRGAGHAHAVLIRAIGDACGRNNPGPSHGPACRSDGRPSSCPS